MIEPLHAGSLHLLPLDITHVDAFIALANEPSIAARVNHPIPFTLEHFAQLLALVHRNERHLVWMIAHDKKAVGMVSASALGHAHIFQIGYWVGTAHRGRNLAAQALALVNPFLFLVAGAVRVQALVEPNHAASIRVLEKNRYAREGLLKRYFSPNGVDLVDVFMYAVHPSP